MYTVIVTALREAKTLTRQIKKILYQFSKFGSSGTIWVCAPDHETQNVVLKYHKNQPNVKLIRDQGKGKPAALNLALAKAEGDILILTDGDVLIGKQAIVHLLAPFQDPKVGAVSGHPLSQNPRTNKFGFWSHLLTEMAHRTRLRRDRHGKYLDCSGYLYAIRAKLINKIPENTLSDDALISTLIYLQGYQINYAPKAKVLVKYPDNLKDWLKQKKRSTGGYVQINQLIKKFKLKMPPKMRSLQKEMAGVGEIFSVAQNWHERWWTIQLIFARIVLWFLIFWEIKMIKKPFRQMWQRVESTK